MSDPQTSATPWARTRSLPNNPNLEHLKREAKSLRRRVVAGDHDALALVAKHIRPDAGAGDEGSPHEFRLTSAQLVVARSYGFASWRRLLDHLQVIGAYSRWPSAPEDDLPSMADLDAWTDRLLRLGCFNYTDDAPETITAGRALLAERPELATRNAFTMAATGAHEELTELLAADPGQATRSGGPFDWDPLLYLCFSRLGTGPDRSAIETMRVLLAAGADPNTGFLWHGMTSAYTALTGVFGGGERDQPPHPDAIAMARLLLEAGADPNDNQTLYNRGFRPANDHLELLFEYGLGREIASPWRSRLGNTYPSPTEMITEELRRAADRGMPERITLLLQKGIDPDGRGYHPIYGDQAPYRLAVLAGRPEVARLLAAAGADTSVVDSVDVFLSACIQGDRAHVQDMSASDPDLTARARERNPATIAKAADLGRVNAVRLLIDLGFDPSRAGQFGRTALHHAAIAGNTELVHLLIKHGADPTAVDDHYNSSPAGWATHGGHLELARYLNGLTAHHQE